jgi:hypothetical protein
VAVGKVKGAAGAVRAPRSRGAAKTATNWAATGTGRAGARKGKPHQMTRRNSKGEHRGRQTGAAGAQATKEEDTAREKPAVSQSGESRRRSRRRDGVARREQSARSISLLETLEFAQLRFYMIAGTICAALGVNGCYM